MTVQSQLDAGIATAIDPLVNGAQYVNTMWGNLFGAYHGDVPIGLALVRCWHETRGNAKATSSQGEKGLLQLFDADSKRFGIDPFDAPSNVWAGMRMWNQRSRDLYKSVPSAFFAPDENFWGCSNLTMSIGKGGTVSLCKKAGGGLDAIVSYIRNNPDGFTSTVDSWYGDSTNRQSAEIVANRVGDTVAWLRAASEFGPLVTLGFGTDVPKITELVLPIALIAAARF